MPTAVEYMQKHWKEISLGGFILVASGLLAYMSLTIGRFQFGDSLQVQARFKSASGMVKGGAVMLAGIEVGHVDKLIVEDSEALMDLSLQPNVKVYKDAKAVIRAKSLLGEKYIALYPGDPASGELKSKERIAVTETPVDLDEVLNHLAPVLTNIDPEDLNTLIHTLAVSVKGKEKELGDLLTGTSNLLSVVGDNKEAVQRIVTNLDGLTAQANSLLRRNGGSIDKAIGDLQVVAASLRKDAPNLLKDVNVVTSDLRQITGPFAPKAPQLAERLDKITADAAQFTDSLSKHPELVPNLNSTLSEIPPLLRKAPATLDRLPALLDKLNPAIDSLDGLGKRAGVTLDKLDPVLDKAGNLLDEEKLRTFLQKEGVKVQIDEEKGGVKVKLF